MSQIPNMNTYNTQPTTPLYAYPNANSQNVTTQQGQTVSVAPSGTTHQIYQYPQTSLYDTSKQAASGVNIYIYNPSAIGGPSANTTYTNPAQMVQPAPQLQPTVQPVVQPIPSTPINEDPLPSTTINNNNTIDNRNQKTKLITELTDDHIRTLESFLRSPDQSVRKSGITQLIKRYEEDLSRYNDPALTALLNIALQDPVPVNQMAAMSPIASGSATGDAKTQQLLEELVKSEAMHGQVSELAKDALINVNQVRTEVPDFSKSK